MGGNVDMNRYVWYDKRENGYVLTFVHENLPLKGFKEGSYNVLFARLCNLSYPQFLRMCRDWYGATLIGKNNLYVVPYFKLNNDFLQLVNYLNKLAIFMMERREHPYDFDYDENGRLIKIYDKEV